MKMSKTSIEGVIVIDIDAHVDERGLFARTFCAETFAAQGLADRFPQSNTSWNRQAGTLRGLHFQDAPKPEAKLVRAIRGRCFDVALDLRPHSPSYKTWTAVELDAERRNAIYIPPGCAHGFVTLVDDCELLYMMSDIYTAELARVVRWNDPSFDIQWPREPSAISPRDADAADFKP